MLKKYWYLKQADLLDGLTETDLAMFEGACIFKQLANKQVIFSPQDLAKRIYILREGQVVLYKLTSEGKKVIIETLKAPTVFGELSFFEDNVQGSYAEASADSVLCVIPKENFMEIIERRPEISVRLLEIAWQRLRQAQETVRDLAVADAKSRILNQLNRLAAKQRAEADKGWLKIDWSLTHEKLANMVGLTRETTTKILNELKDEGILKIEKKTIFLREIM